MISEKDCILTDIVEKKLGTSQNVPRALRHKTVNVTKLFTSLFFAERTSCAFIVRRKKFCWQS